jgi:hypothetical protein
LKFSEPLSRVIKATDEDMIDIFHTNAGKLFLIIKRILGKMISEYHVLWQMLSNPA